MAVDDTAGPAQGTERRQAESGRAGLGLGVPDALHDELEVGSLDRIARPAFGCGDLVEHGVDELGLGCAGRTVLLEGGVALERAEDCRASGVTAEAIET